ncbi:MAG TPA: rhodanese-like domain-containing protein [Lacipirellulaceae bacterium]|nr:rhodanese-like domain-containing protein [Lacipirellulaceae bacterium]
MSPTILPDSTAIPTKQRDTTSVKCGVYALLVCAGILQVPVRPEQIVRDEFISSAKGSTTSDLMRAGGKVGMSVSRLSRLATADLAALPPPYVLHVRSAPWSREYDHFVAVLDQQGDQLQVFDPMTGEAQVWTATELALGWGGEVLHTTSLDNHSFATHLLLPSNVFVITASVAVWTILLGTRRACGKRIPVVLGTQFLLSVGLVLMIQWTAVTTTVPVTSSAVDRYFTAQFLDVLSPDQLASILESNNPPLILDVRDVGSYASSHIPFSQNLPLEIIWSQSLPGLKRAIPDGPASIVVYCSDDKCDAARYAAQALRAAGAQNVFVLGGGLEAWRAHGLPVEGDIQ